jgi:hypothetical protein
MICIVDELEQLICLFFFFHFRLSDELIKKNLKFTESVKRGGQTTCRIEFNGNGLRHLNSKMFFLLFSVKTFTKFYRFFLNFILGFCPGRLVLKPF